MKRFLRTGLMLIVADLYSGTLLAQSSAASDAAAPAAALAADSADVAATGVVSSVKVDVSHSSQGMVTELAPEIGYGFGHWTITFGVPFASSGVSGTTTPSSHYGLGDTYLDLQFAVGSETSFSSTLVGTEPTGDSSRGLGAGRATWNWTNHLDRAIGWLVPFVDASIGNSINSATSISLQGSGRAGRPSRVITIPTRPYTTVGRVAHLDAGADIDLSRSVELSVLGYETVPRGNQTAFSRFVPVKLATSGGTIRPAPLSRTARGYRFFEVNAVTTGDASLVRDSGVGASVSVKPTRYLNVTASYSHSILMKLDTAAITLTTSIPDWFRVPSEHP